ncbi:MAG TPA: hypothetical protein VGD17_13325 [Chitinophagaceae bacterium]
MASPAVAKAIIHDIMHAIGAKATFEVRAAKIPNAAAASAKGKRYISYNPEFMAALHKATGSNRWAPISILAHETRKGADSHTRESKPPVAEETIVIDDRLLAYDVHFTDDPGGRYHVTVRNNLIKLSGNKISLIGKQHSIQNEDYPVAVRTQSNLFLVDKKGLVITTRG